MTEAASNYDRLNNDKYYTPAWATRVMMRHITNNKLCKPDALFIDPACGDGGMAYVIKNCAPDATVIATDIDPDPKLVEWLPGIFHYEMASVDFLLAEPIMTHGNGVHIITNPPYGKGGHLGARFVRKALDITKASYGTVSMLLPMKFDSGKTRRDIFGDHPAFDCKIVMLDRLRWTNLPQKKAGPTGDHAWYFWDWSRVADTEPAYAPAIKYALKADHDD